MAAGMCSLTTAVGGIPQTLGEPEWNSLPTGKDGCGVMVEAKNSRMLTEALEELLLMKICAAKLVQKRGCGCRSIMR